MRQKKVKWVIRGFCLAIILVTVVAFITTFVSAGEYPNRAYETAVNTDEAVVADRSGITVVTTQYNEVREVSGEIVAISPDGRIQYYNDSLNSYWDVDPSPHGDHTVMYVATERLNKSRCGSEQCRRNVVERVNLTTGETERLYEHRVQNKRWHDVDRIDESRLLVGDMGADAVFILNTTTGIREWGWAVESTYDIDSGGSYTKDWAHLNDVEMLSDGRIMVSLRNHDRVVFLNQSTGVMHDWTLGEEDNHSILYEQHNPDYIPGNSSTPNVILADSESNQVEEYSRTADGDWRQVWAWEDQQLQWPRDADRLPNGHTLITDSNGNRVIEVNESGEVVWSLPITRPYEAERLGTGDESTRGEKKTGRIKTASRTEESDTSDLRTVLSTVIPSPMRNGIAYIIPWWAGFQHAVLLGITFVSIIAWGCCEMWWSSWSIQTQWPVIIRHVEK